MHVKVLDEAVVERAKARGLDALVYAPHFVRLPEIRRRAEAFSDDELLVVPAREIFTGDWKNRKHILAVGLEDLIPDFITLTGAMEELERQDAAVLIPHPAFLNVSFNRGDIRRWRDQIHAVESYNPKLLFGTDERAEELVDESERPAFGSSYAHIRPSIGEVWTEFDRAFDSVSGLVDGIRDGAPREVVQRNGLGHRIRSMAEFAHLGWENSWHKIDRLFLQGTEPTHPRHIAYQGRFDDVAVY
ncbi:PHP-associated domain-containing protein [Haloarchaeobius sp. TZWWS8]|uniref:PHP-associated domain-containing protein n=1 Tax=Haloarchaeobius sp. TZWWS8 TaxID=3446121 RepID=UPI003EBB304E